MNILQRFFPFTKQGTIKNPFAIMMERRFSEMFGTTARKLFLEANKGWVYACVQAIAQEVSNIELKLVRENKDGETEDVDNEVSELLNKVNPRMTRHELFEITQSHLELDGNAFWLLARNGVNQIGEIWPLRPDRVMLVPDKENALMVGRYEYRQKNGKKIFLEPDDVIHFADFNAEGDYPFPVRGVGRVQAASLAIDTSNFSREWNRVFFLNSAIPNIILKTTAALDPDNYKQLQEKFKQSFQGLAKAHKPMLLEGGLEIEKLGGTQKDMDFVKQLASSRDEIFGIFRVPKAILGIVEDVNRANAEASIFIFMRGTIKPKMQYIVDTLNEFLLPKFGETSDLKFIFESPIPENRERVLDEYAKGHGKWLTTNDIRRAEGLPETVDGDNIFAPFNQVPIDRIKARKIIKVTIPKAKKETEEVDEKLSTDELIKKSTKKFVTALFNKKTKGKKKKDKEAEKPEQMSPSQVAKFVDIWKQGLVGRREETVPVVQEYFDEQEVRTQASVRSGLKGLKKKEYSLKQAENLLPDKDEEIKAAIDMMTPLYQEFLETSGQEGAELVDPEFTFDPSTEPSQDFVDERAQFFAQSINDTTFEELIKTLDEGLANDESLAELSERVAKVYGKTRDFRTDLIARTEVSAISNFGNTEGMKQAGATQKMWVVVTPEDDPCLIEGEVVGIDEAFSNGLEAPPAHPNCQCSTIPIF